MKDYKTRVEESTRLACPRLVAELEHLKIETRLIDEMRREIEASSKTFFFPFETRTRKKQVAVVGKEEIEERDQGLATWCTCAGRTRLRFVCVQVLKMSSSVLVRNLALSPFNRAVCSPRIHPRRRDRGLGIKD
jgi:hypothetical protein